MPTAVDFPCRGKIVKIEGQSVTFNPANYNYEMGLDAEASLDGVPVGTTVEVLIRAQARKLWTVPSGGNFVDPIFGRPRTIQGRIKYLDDRQMVVQAGVMLIVTLPKDDAAYDLTRGPLTEGGLVNVALMPGATVEVVH